jgi:hypothetical protein
MYIPDNISSKNKPLGLREFIPLGITYFIGLVFLSVYQNTVLYVEGVLDGILEKSFFLLLVHHLGFASICALVMAFLFNFLETKKPSLGFKVTKVVVISLLISEALLTTYYVQNFEVLGSQLFKGLSASTTVRFSIIMAFSAIIGVLGLCYVVHRKISSAYVLISRMYPVTLIMFTMFLATLASETREVNENKTQHLLTSMVRQLFSNQDYDGLVEYPLLRPYTPLNSLAPFFELKDSMPNIKIIVIDGLAVDFIGSDRPYSTFMPFLNQLQEKSLYWSNFLSNSGEGYNAIASITGSLPFGEEGFTKMNSFNYRNTLYSILRSNGYATSFSYGGNTTLVGLDKFLEEEQVTTIVDKNAFGSEYEQQNKDAAGISLGYPDAALYDRYHQIKKSTFPMFDVLFTLSTRAPYLIPQGARYAKDVLQLLEDQERPRKTKRFIEQHTELFASYLYADASLRAFMEEEQKNKEFQNTIYIITGSHYSTNLPQENRLTRYKVPFMVYSPLLKGPEIFMQRSSHADVAPTLMSLLDDEYDLKVPQSVAWIGGALLGDDKNKQIPFLRAPHHFQEFMLGSYFMTEGDIFVLDDTMGLAPAENSTKIKEIEDAFNRFKSINSYVTLQNKIIPEKLSLVKDSDKTFTKEELVWIHSVFNGDNFDNAYATAHKLAMKKEWERAKLLCSYILNEIPRHADTEILLGRLHGWQKEYAISIKILERVVRKYPKYSDAYCALMDSYYWAGRYEMMYDVKKLAEKNDIEDTLLKEKFKRAKTLLEEKQIHNKTLKTTKVSFEDTQSP